MRRVRFSHGLPGRRFCARQLPLAGVVLAVVAARAFSAAPEKRILSRIRLAEPFIVAQLPASVASENCGPVCGGMLRACYGDEARLVLVLPNSPPRVLSRGFHSACDPDVSFDAGRVLFAGKKTASDNWNIYEMSVDGSNVRRITRDLGDCRSPGYQSTLYTIISPKPWYQLTFVGNAAGTMNEYGSAAATSLYSCKLDGSAARRLTFNLSSDVDPFLMPDGRLLFAGWQRSTLGRGTFGRVGLFGVNIDGADYALFAGEQGRRIRHMPCVTTGGLAVFVEADEVPWDGAGCVASVQIRRPLHSYRPITRREDGLFHSPSPLPDGSLLVSRRPADGSGTHGLYRLDPCSGKCTLIFDDPRYHEIQAKIIHPRDEPDGRSSVVTEKDPHGKLYCLNVYISDLKQREWMPRGTVKRLRVLEGIPLNTGDRAAYLPAIETLPARRPGSTANGLPPLVQRRMLGEIDIQQDGSLNIEVPANTPIELQILDAQGMGLRSCSWIWAKNHEPRGCIGCHEDGELTPENFLMEAAVRASVPLCLPPQRRRTVDFRRDVMPIINRKCAACHRPGESPPRLDGGLELVAHAGGKAYFNRAYENLLATEESGEAASFRGKYVDPGKARTSPLIWHIYGRNTSRPWDAVAAKRPVTPIPPGKSPPLTEDEKRTLVEWIDMGAMWDGIPGADNLPGGDSTAKGETK